MCRIFAIILALGACVTHAQSLRDQALEARSAAYDSGMRDKDSKRTRTDEGFVGGAGGQMDGAPSALPGDGGDGGDGGGVTTGAGDYVPTTYGLQMNQYMPADYEFRFPLVVSFDRDPNMPPPGPALPWSSINGPSGLEYQGQWLSPYSPEFQLPFGMQVYNGPNYPSPETTDYPSGVFIVKYNGMFCPDPSLIDVAPELFATPLPPSFAEVQVKANEFCVNECGSGFEMTDFDMTQWQYTCYIDGAEGKAYQVASWGGSKCEKTEDNGLIQACNPLTGMIAIRGHLRESASTYPEGDLDGDGVISMVDLIRARNIAFGPKLQGIGESRMLIKRSFLEDAPGNGTFSSLSAEEAMLRLDEVVVIDGAQTFADIFEITHWEPGIPVICPDPNIHDPVQYQDIVNQHFTYLAEFTSGNGGTPGAALNDDYCAATHGPGSLCAAGADVAGVGHCKVNSDGTHTIRLVGGNCMKCI